MNKTLSKRLIAALIAAAFPLAAPAADEDLARRIEALSKEIEQLKNQVKANEEKTTKAAEALKTLEQKPASGEVEELRNQVKKVEEKSIGRWLTFGGDYRFRIDYLSGDTRTFTDVNATFNNVQQALQGDFFANPSTVPGSSSFFGGFGLSTAGALTAFANFSQNMMNATTIAQAQAFVSNPANAGLIQGIGNFAVQIPAQTVKNETLYTNRLRLDLGAKATEDVSVNARLLMYKTFGAQDDAAVTNSGSAPFFADRVGVFDGTLGHIPSESHLAVDRAYATWHNILDKDLWFSVGRRPSTQGAPSHLRLNEPRPGTGGTPSILVDYAFDGMTIGYAPEIDALPGAFAKICYGRGFESGYRTTPGNSISDTDMFGISVVAIDTDPLRIWAQWNRGVNIFDAPKMNNTYFGNTAPTVNLGSIDWFGVGALSTFKGVGSGDLHLFADAALSKTHPNNNVSPQFGFQGLLTGGFFQPEIPNDKTGWAVALGMRYDLPSRTKIGFEFNHGSKDWITFAPAADDMWTAKVGTRGNVYEAYVIQELNKQPISSFFSKAFFRLGFQYYDFKYTGSNNWVGAPVKMSDVNGQLMALTPLENAYNVYGTFEVKF